MAQPKNSQKHINSKHCATNGSYFMPYFPAIQNTCKSKSVNKQEGLHQITCHLINRLSTRCDQFRQPFSQLYYQIYLLQYSPLNITLAMNCQDFFSLLSALRNHPSQHYNILNTNGWHDLCLNLYSIIQFLPNSIKNVFMLIPSVS